MLKLALAFFLVALIAGFLGFGGVAAASMGVAKIIFFVFLALCLLAIMAGVGLFGAVFS